MEVIKKIFVSESNSIYRYMNSVFFGL